MTFVDEPVFQTIVFGFYVLMLWTLIAISVVGILLIRRRLLHVRERKTELIRKEFNPFEEASWRKVDRNESPQPEADHIMTMDTMFDRLHSMKLWPINVATLSRLAASAASSAAVALYQAGWIELPR